LVQTRKMRKRIPIVLYGKRFWDEIINFDALIRYGTISPEDIDLFHRTDSVDELFTIITRQLIEYSIATPGAVLMGTPKSDHRFRRSRRRL
jgi:predicted Rossmann-fold nucleotide-binding protein